MPLQVKVMQPAGKEKASHMQKFIAEIEVLHNCRDDHIVAFRGAWVDQVLMLNISAAAHLRWLQSIAFAMMNFVVLTATCP